MLAAPTPASPHWNPCDDDAVARETEAMTAAFAGPLAEPPPVRAQHGRERRGRRAQHQNRGCRNQQPLNRFEHLSPPHRRTELRIAKLRTR